VPRRLAVRYFALQALAITAWWIVLATVPASLHWFAPESFPPRTLGAFAPADFGVVIASAMVAWGNTRPWAIPLAWVVAGAMTYAAVYTLTAAMLGVGTLLSVILMVPVAIASLAAATALARGNHEAVPARAQS
jgi:hypothetical protein